MIRNQTKLYRAFTSLVGAALIVSALPAQAQSVNTYENGSVTVYGLSDTGAAAAAVRPEQAAPVMTTLNTSSVSSYNNAVPLVGNAPSTAVPASVDTSYGELHIVNPDELLAAEPAAVPAPVTMPAVAAEPFMATPAPVIAPGQPLDAVAPPAPGVGMKPILEEGGASMEAMATMPAPVPEIVPVPTAPVIEPQPVLSQEGQVSLPPSVAADAAPVAPAPVQETVMPPVVAAPVLPEAENKSAALSLLPALNQPTPESCAINQSMMEKMALLEKEKETLRARTSGMSDSLKPLAQCAAETSKIQSLEAEIAYLRDENDSLKRISNERIAAQSLPSTASIPATEAPLDEAVTP